MRKLKFKDVGKASSILKKLNLRVDKDLKLEDAETMGASLFLKLAENYSQVQDDVAEFMAGLLEDENITKKDFLELELEDVYTYFEKLKEDEGLKGFLSMLSKTTQSNTK